MKPEIMGGEKWELEISAGAAISNGTKRKLNLTLHLKLGENKINLKVLNKFSIIWLHVEEHGATLLAE